MTKGQVVGEAELSGYVFIDTQDQNLIQGHNLIQKTLTSGVSIFGSWRPCSQAGRVISPQRSVWTEGQLCECLPVSGLLTATHTAVVKAPSTIWEDQH